jgi:hypothetical protein
MTNARSWKGRAESSREQLGSNRGAIFDFYVDDFENIDEVLTIKDEIEVW